MPDTQPPAFPGTPDEPKKPSASEKAEASGTPQFPTAPQFSSAPPTPPTPRVPPVSDYGTPPPQPPQAYPSSTQYGSGQNGSGPYGSAQYASAQYPAAPYAPGTIRPRTGPSALALSSLIIGSLALLGSFIPFLNYITGFFAFIALVLGVIAIFLKGRKKTLAIVASSVSLLALILSIVLSIVYTGLFVDDVNDSLETDYPTTTSAPLVPGDDTSTGEQGAPAAGDLGSKEKPVPLGSSVELTQFGDPAWTVTLNAPTLSADAAVAAENSFNDKAPAGTSYALLPVTVTYNGDENGYPSLVQISFEAADGTTYNQYDTIVVTPGGLDPVTEVPLGSSASGNVAVAIPTSGVEQGHWVVSSLDGTKFYFAAK